MRAKHFLVVAPLLALVAGAPAASADLELSHHPNARESTCRAEFSGSGEARCTVTVIGRHFAVGVRGSGVIRAALEPASAVAGVPGQDLASCSVASVFDSCVGASVFDEAPLELGTEVACVAYGVGGGTFECSIFDID